MSRIRSASLSDSEEKTASLNQAFMILSTAVLSSKPNSYLHLTGPLGSFVQPLNVPYYLASDCRLATVGSSLFKVYMQCDRRSPGGITDVAVAATTEPLEHLIIPYRAGPRSGPG